MKKKHHSDNRKKLLDRIKQMIGFIRDILYKVFDLSWPTL